MLMLKKLTLVSALAVAPLTLLGCGGSGGGTQDDGPRPGGDGGDGGGGGGGGSAAEQAIKAAIANGAVQNYNGTPPAVNATLVDAAFDAIVAKVIADGTLNGQNQTKQEILDALDSWTADQAVPTEFVSGITAILDGSFPSDGSFGWTKELKKALFSIMAKPALLALQAYARNGAIINYASPPPDDAGIVTRVLDAAINCTSAALKGADVSLSGALRTWNANTESAVPKPFQECADSILSGTYPVLDGSDWTEDDATQLRNFQSVPAITALKAIVRAAVTESTETPPPDDEVVSRAFSESVECTSKALAEDNGPSLQTVLSQWRDGVDAAPAKFVNCLRSVLDGTYPA